MTRQQRIVFIDGTYVFIDLSRDQFKSEKVFDLISHGTEELEKGNFRSAKLIFIKANLIEPKNKDIYVAMALAEYFLRNYQDALRIDIAAIELDTEYIPPPVNMTVALNRMHRYAEALRISNEILSKKNLSRLQLSAVFYNKSLTEHGLNNIEGALKSIDCSIVNCDDANVLKSLESFKVELLAEQKKLSDQKDFVKQMLERGKVIVDTVSN